MKRTFVVSTKQDSDSQPKVTNLTVTFPDGTPVWLMEGYEAFLTVKLQGTWRRKGIPATFECNAQDYAPGKRSAPMSLEQALGALSPEERKVLLAKYSA